jgi:hypothetical protein
MMCSYAYDMWVCFWCVGIFMMCEYVYDVWVYLWCVDMFMVYVYVMMCRYVSDV